MKLMTFGEHASNSDHTPDLLNEAFSPGVTKAASLAILFKLSHLGRTIKSPECKALSDQLFLVASMIALAINTIDNKR
jgi:hypothetical protein